jgi:hypothetical protein
MDGRVLVTGGSDERGQAIGLAEIFDPVAGAWSAAAANVIPRLGHAASLLHDGRVLVVGGVPFASSCEPIALAEVYDPSVDRWSRTSQIPVPVGRGTAAVTLSDGRVLISGGGTACGDEYSSAALFDPSTNMWSRTAAMEVPAQFHIATLLADGRVLVSGTSTSAYDASTGLWAPLGDPRPLTEVPCEGDVRRYSSALGRNSLIARATPDDCPSLTVLPAGTLLIAGGCSTITNAEQDSVQVSDLSSGEAVWSWPMQVARAGHTATRLKNGVVLIAGGRKGPARTASSELYIPRLPYEAWTAAMPRGWSNRLESVSYGRYAAAATNSRNHLFVSYTGGNYGSQLIEWIPRWADFATGAHWVEAPHPQPLTRIGGPYPPYRALGPDVPTLNSIRVDEHDNIWGVSSAAQEVFKISPDGRVLLRFGKPPSTDTSGPSDTSPSELRQYVENPSDLSIDRRGNVFVADSAERPRIVKFDSRGRFVAETGRKGSRPGSVDLPHSLATDAGGNVYVADSGNARIQVFDNSLNLRAVYHDVGTPWALCITKGSRQFLYSASNPERGETHRTAEIFKLELDGTILGKVVGDEPGKVIVTLQHIDCREANTAAGVGYIDLKRITFGR